MIGIPLGLLYANAIEWAVHKHVLHGLGKDRSSFWAFHWHEHHKNVRRADHLDSDYHRPLGEWNAQSKEALALALGVAAHLPLLPIAPFFTATMAYSAVNYYFTHKRSHLDPQWAHDHLPWHFDHHMGPNQDKNWCVTRPWFDWIMGTREKYAGTAREAADIEKKRTRAQRRQDQAPASDSAADAPPAARELVAA